MTFVIAVFYDQEDVSGSTSQEDEAEIGKLQEQASNLRMVMSNLKHCYSCFKILILLSSHLHYTHDQLKKFDNGLDRIK